MGEAKFTEGPYSLKREADTAGTLFIVDADDDPLAMVLSSDADGALFVAAPELFYELRQARHDVAILLAMLLGSLEADAPPDDPDDLSMLSEIKTGYDTPSAALAKASPTSQS